MLHINVVHQSNKSFCVFYCRSYLTSVNISRRCRAVQLLSGILQRLVNFKLNQQQGMFTYYGLLLRLVTSSGGQTKDFCSLLEARIYCFIILHVELQGLMSKLYSEVFLTCFLFC